MVGTRLSDLMWRRVIEVSLAEPVLRWSQAPPGGKPSSSRSKQRRNAVALGRKAGAVDVAAHLVDRLLPEAPYRQWVLTFPWEMRFLLAMDR